MNETELESLWKIGLDLKNQYTNKELSQQEKIHFAQECIRNFESYIYKANLNKKPTKDKKTYLALRYSADAYSFLGDENQAKEYYTFSENFLCKEENRPKNAFEFNESKNKRMFIVDNFYKNPDEVRNFALTQVEYQEDLMWYKGLRSKISYKPPGIKEAFEDVMGEKITIFDDHYYNGCFQLCKSSDIQVYHCDAQRWAAMIYLTPNAPIESGTRLHRSRITGCRHNSDPNIEESFSGDFYDSTKFDIVDGAGNIYNRLVIMDAKCIHSAGPYFGYTPETCRLTHLFFFD
jgi:hypothetical protein